jgi:hypothetical protein
MVEKNRNGPNRPRRLNLIAESPQPHAKIQILRRAPPHRRPSAPRKPPGEPAPGEGKEKPPDRAEGLRSKGLGGFAGRDGGGKGEPRTSFDTENTETRKKTEKTPSFRPAL